MCWVTKQSDHIHRFYIVKHLVSVESLWNPKNLNDTEFEFNILFKHLVFIESSVIRKSLSTMRFNQKQPSKVFYKKAVLKIVNHPQEHTCVGVPFWYVADRQPFKCFSVCMAKFLIIATLKNICERLLLLNSVNMYVIYSQFNQPISNVTFFICPWLSHQDLK